MKTKPLLKFLALVAIVCCQDSCTYDEIPKTFDCATSDLKVSLVSKADATSCKSINGQVTMTASGGFGPYDYSLGDGVYQTNPVFDKLAAGSYSITAKDTKGCKSSVQVEVASANSNLTATTSSAPDTECFSDNGSISVSPSGGSSPYVIKLDDGAFGTATTFLNISGGAHSIIVKDAGDCQKVFNVTVDRGNSGLSYSKDISPIFAASCNFGGCHGAGETGRDWTKFADVKSKAADIKSRTIGKSMPIGGFTLTQKQIQQIACWVDDGANNN